MASKKKKALKLVFASNNVMEAEETRCFLEGSGVNARILDSRLVSLNPVLGGPVGGVKVVVPEDEYERALETLKAAGRTDTGEKYHPYDGMLKGMSTNDKRWILGILFGLVALLTIGAWIASINSAY